MAIQFARCAFVSRSTGGNACRKASYNQREEIRCDRTGELFSFANRGGNVHHEVLLPVGANDKFKNAEALWNEAEHAERRKDSQVAREFVLALPDDAEISHEDRVELTRRFSQANFADKGVAVQLDIHAPHDNEKNWHAHLLVTTRRFSEDGLSLHSLKAEDLNPIIKGRKVVEADAWGTIWKDTQNAYFEEMGYEVRVDPIGILPQEHMGPVRMRHHMNEALIRSQLIEKANEQLARDPGSVIEELTKTRALFSQKDLQHFLEKYVPQDERELLQEKVLNSPRMLPLFDKASGKESSYFTTKDVRAEEEKLVRFVDSISKKNCIALSPASVAKGLEGKELSSEQREAYDLCVSSRENLSIIQGRAGVGKSYLLDGIRKAHEASGYRVLGLSPTHKVAEDLRTSGFKEAKTLHSFLFSFKNNRERLNPKTLLIVDEAGMLGTTLSVELFNVVKACGAKIVLVGDDRQLSSVDRGGTFRYLANRFKSVELNEVRRQTIDWQKSVSEDLSKGDARSAVHLMEQNKCIFWQETKAEALASLLKDWGKSRDLNPTGTHQILAQKNVDVDALNDGAREILRVQGRLGEVELTCMTGRGMASFAEGDRIHFTKTNKEQGIMNGTFGTIEKIDPETKKVTVHLDNKEVKEVDPNTYDGLRHGYASTVYRAQGATLAHVHVLHSNVANAPTNYVSMTRQTASLSLYVSKEETPSRGHLIEQMERTDGNRTSLVFDTQKDLDLKKASTLTGQIVHGAQTFFTKVKDIFHENEGFYRFTKPKEILMNKPTVSTPKHDPLHDLTKSCEGHMYDYLAKENKPLTPELIERVSVQSAKAADYIYHDHAQGKSQLTADLEKNKVYYHRAKLELNRIPELRQQLIQDGKKAGTFNDRTDGLVAHMLAERRVAIEGRLYLESIQKGTNVSSAIPAVAKRELELNHAQTEKLAQKLAKTHGLTHATAQESAKNIQRFKEANGSDPSKAQVKTIVNIACDLEKRREDLASEGHNKYETLYLLRKESDLMLRQRMSTNKSLTLEELHHIQTQSRASLNALTPHIDHAKSQAQTSLEAMNRQIVKDQEVVHEHEISM